MYVKRYLAGKVGFSSLWLPGGAKIFREWAE